MSELVAVDVGGTHVRFALANVANGTIALGDSVTLETADHPDLESAWHAFEQMAGVALPRAAAVAIAGPVNGDKVPMTNSPWVLHISAFERAAGLDAVTVLNDFGAVAHAAALAEAGRMLGYHVTVSDARARFVTPERIPQADELVVGWPDEVLRDAPVDERTAICVLTHDRKLDVPALEAMITALGEIK